MVGWLTLTEKTCYNSYFYYYYFFIWAQEHVELRFEPSPLGYAQVGDFSFSFLFFFSPFFKRNKHFSYKQKLHKIKGNPMPKMIIKTAQFGISWKEVITKQSKNYTLHQEEVQKLK